MNLKRLKKLVGLELANGHLTVVELHRAGGGQLEVAHALSGTLALDPLNAAPELAAREIRNLLSQAQLSASACVVCLPLGQVLMHRVVLPEAIAEEDVAEFLNLEAERAFPFPPQELAISVSRYADLGGAQCATLAAVAASQVMALEKVLHLAGLRLVGATVGTAALAPMGSEPVEGVIGQTAAGTELLVAVHGGVAAMRLLEHDSAGATEESFDGEALLRDLRITLARLPHEARANLHRLRLFGTLKSRQALAQALGPELQLHELSLEPIGVDKHARVIASNEEAYPVGPVLAAASYLQSGRAVFEFLPPQVNQFSRVTKAMLARGMTWKLGAGAGGIILLVVLAFLWQSWRVNSLEQRWQAMRPQAESLKTLQEAIRQYEPWYDTEVHSLDILQNLTGAFPETGSAWVRSIQMKGLSTIECTGNATSNADVLRIQDQLRKSPAVDDLKISQLRGEKPVQFGLIYHWKEAGDHVK